MKKVSIIVPVYNMEDKIVLSVESLLEQTYSDTEIILIDDGSTDGTYEKCIALAEKNKHVKVIRTLNQGSGLARNVGITSATGDYAYFPDADDVLDHSAIDLLVKSMEKSQSDLIVFGFRNVNSKGKILNEKKYSSHLFSGDYIRHHYEAFISINADFWIQGAPWNKFFDLSLIRKYNIAYPSLRRHQDEVFISRYVEKVESVLFVEDSLYTYYTNNVKKEWQKYPVDYLDIAVKLRKYREEIIINWNKDNHNVRDMIEREYIFNFTKGLELSFSKKMNLTRKTRKQWIKNMVEVNHFFDARLPGNSEMAYQKKVLTLIKHKKFSRLYALLSLKVFLEKNMYPLFFLTKALVKKRV